MRQIGLRLTRFISTSKLFFAASQRAFNDRGNFKRSRQIYSEIAKIHLHDQSTSLLPPPLHSRFDGHFPFAGAGSSESS